ncbi:BTAD domain-containing putative transcriptional regulator [Streptomyces sp. CA-106131]|uniref:BTAD domain-containing putative transcriptional regulator n=1 Tax=Streptomyces sp. CA-106131 TaxID=3240045 RepID=UPI003D92F7CE
MPSCTTALILGEPVHLRLIGPLELLGSKPGNPPGIPKGRAELLFALLAAHRNRVVSKDTIIETLWPDHVPPTAPQTVASLVSRLRKVVGTCLERTGSGYRLNTTGWQVDVDEAARLTQAAERHLHAGEPAFADVAARRALDLLSAGRAVEEFQPAGWSQDLDRTLERLVRRAREAAWQAAHHLNDHRQAAHLAAAAAHDDPYDEPAWRALMTAQYRLGSAGAALHTFSRLRRTLRTELGADPDPHTTALHGAIRQGRPTPTPAHPRPAAPAGATHPHLAGRDEELDQLQALWRQALTGQQPTTVVLRGGAGAGTSALLSALHRHAHHHGATVLAAQCPQPERLLATPALEQAIADYCRTARPEEVTRAADGIAHRLRAAMPHIDTITGAAGHGDEHTRPPTHAHTDAAALFLRRLSTDHPVLLAVDDAHYADARTLETLHHLTQGDTGHRMMVVLGAREDGADRIARHLPHTTQLPLEPLAPPAVAELAARHDLPQAAHRVHQLTAGRPALVLAALQAAHQGAPLDEPDHLPDTLINAALDLVHHVGEPMTHLLRTAALIGPTFRFEQLLKATGTDGWKTAQQIEQALRVGLLTADGDTLMFDGELLHIALYQAVPAPLRAGLAAYARSR